MHTPSDIEESDRVASTASFAGVKPGVAISAAVVLGVIGAAALSGASALVADPDLGFDSPSRLAPYLTVFAAEIGLAMLVAAVARWRGTSRAEDVAALVVGNGLLVPWALVIGHFEAVPPGAVFSAMVFTLLSGGTRRRKRNGTDARLAPYAVAFPVAVLWAGVAVALLLSPWSYWAAKQLSDVDLDPDPLLWLPLLGLGWSVVLAAIGAALARFVRSPKALGTGMVIAVGIAGPVSTLAFGAHPLDGHFWYATAVGTAWSAAMVVALFGAAHDWYRSPEIYALLCLPQPRRRWPVGLASLLIAALCLWVLGAVLSRFGPHSPYHDIPEFSADLCHELDFSAWEAYAGEMSAGSFEASANTWTESRPAELLCSGTTGPDAEISVVISEERFVKEAKATWDFSRQDYKANGDFEVFDHPGLGSSAFIAYLIDNGELVIEATQGTLVVAVHSRMTHDGVFGAAHREAMTDLAAQALSKFGDAPA